VRAVATADGASMLAVRGSAVPSLRLSPSVRTISPRRAGSAGRTGVFVDGQWAIMTFVF
jgi:hypothetical protein